MRDSTDAFAEGDYLSTALHLSSDRWQYWASLGLIGHPANAAEELQRFTDPDALFYSGVASWIAGDDDRARHVLARCQGSHARRLLELIVNRPITVLAQLPWNRNGSLDILGQLKDPAFHVLNVSFHPDDIQNQPYADVRKLIPPDARPDFYVAEMLEWHLIPPNVRTLGCPVLGHSSDFDLHIQTVAPWLELFDELIVLDHAEWRDMSHVVRVPVSVFPKVFGVPAHLPDVPADGRDVDVFLSGTITHPYHSDKERVVLDILRIPDIRVRMVQGFEAPDTYYKNLAASKVCCTFVRHAGAMPTRGLEALGMGCAVAVQEESALRLFVGENEGVVAYRSDGEDLVPVIQMLLSGWSDYSDRARRGAGIVRREFALDRVASQYFRFLTFLAARPRAARRGPDPDQLVQKRPVVHKGWLPSYRFGKGLLMEWASASAARLERRQAAEETAQSLNDLARERLLAHYHDHGSAPEWLDTVVTPLERAIERFPAALVPRFNLARALLHFGTPAQVRRGVALVDEVLNASIVQWQVDPLDDVLPWDFCPSVFNYRRYFDAVTRSFGSSDSAAETFTAVILASLNHYRSKYAAEIVSERCELDYASEAVRLDPEFSEYVLDYCRLLVGRGRSADHVAASTTLQSLALRSARQIEILDIAGRLPAALKGDWFADLEARAGRLWLATYQREYLPEPILRSSIAYTDRREPKGSPNR